MGTLACDKSSQVRNVSRLILRAVTSRRACMAPSGRPTSWLFDAMDGLWFGTAFVVIALTITALTLIG